MVLNIKDEVEVLIEIGDKVVGKNGETLLYCGTGIYPFAIVISLNPFVMVSECTTMRWSCQKIEDFKSVGRASWWRIIYCKWKRKNG